MRQIRVLLADDHKLIRSGLKLVIQQQADLVVVGEADDGRQAVELARSAKPDVVVMDIGMPNLNGIEACYQITQGNPSAAVVMLSMHADESYVLRALKAGARAYLLKDSAEADLAPCHPRRRRGQVLLQPGSGQSAFARLCAENAAHWGDGLLRPTDSAGA